MAKHVCLEGGLLHASGNVKAVCDDGTKKVIRLRMTPTGRQIMGFGQPKRDLIKKPYTPGEDSQKARFKAAAQLGKMIREDMALKSQWVARFRADKNTTAVTFNGYLLQQAMWGHISEEGAYVA